MPAKPYSMPAINVGDVVLWRHNHASPEVAPALVTKVGQMGIGLTMFPPESRSGTTKDGVRHVSDPSLATVITSETGVWDYTDSHRLLLALHNLAAVAQGAKPAK